MPDSINNSAPKLGPFEVSDPIPAASNVQTVAGFSGCEERYLVRELDCKNYQTCLNLAAALNWDSFTCESCEGDINESLKWRAIHSTRKDALANALCPDVGFNQRFSNKNKIR